MRRILSLVLAFVAWASLASAQPAVYSVGSRGALEAPFSTTTAQAVASVDVADYRWVSVHMTSQGGSSTVTFQSSNDNINWVSTALLISTAIGASAPVTSTTSTGLWDGPLTGRYFRLNVTGIASGTTAGVVEFSAQPAATLTSLNSINGVLPASAAANLGKVEDAPHTTGDTGVAVWGVRKDTATQTTNADADYAQVSVDAYGAVFTRLGHPNLFACSLDNIAATLTECQAAPSAGLSLYVTDIVAQSTTATAGQFLLRQGTGTNCGTGTASVFPSAASVIRYTAPPNTVPPTVVSLSTPVKLTAANALCLLGVATNTVTLQVTGFTAP